MPFGIQPIHIIIVIAVAFLLFGGSKLPEMGRSLGKTITEFRKGTKEAAEGFKTEVAGNNSAAVPLAVSALASSPAPAAERAFSPAGNFCIQCGSTNLPEARFCGSCGAKLPEKNS